MLAGGPLDIFDDLLAGAFAFSSCLSHLPLLIGYDELTTLSYQILLFGPISADVISAMTLSRHMERRVLAERWADHVTGGTGQVVKLAGAG
jgi:hypothetical protein